MARTVAICEGPAQLAEQAAELIAAAARRSVTARGRFTVCLAGGDTPVATYRRLARPEAGLPWSRVHVFWGDERCIPLERPDNHFTLANESLLSRVPIPSANVHRARGELADASQAALDYELTLRKFFGQGCAVPVFDLVLLGMGEDGHVASIFAESEGFRERRRWVVDHYVLKRGQRVRRLTLTMPVLTAAREVLILVAGEHKAQMLASVLEGSAAVPASEVDASAARVSWMVDRAAAGTLAARTGAGAEVRG